MSIIPDNWQVRRIAGALGAEITGPDIASADATEAEALRQLLLEHKVIFLPGQAPEVDAHIAFGRHYGPLEGHPNLHGHSEVPAEIFELRASAGGVADEWHTDLTCQDSPALMSILHMVTCPEYGGDTMWSNLEAAYDALSKPMQDLCSKLTALHDAHPHGRPEQTAIHPVVRVHPETGRRSLYVNEHFTRRIVEMSAAESKVMLELLTGWVAQPRFTVRYQWSAGTIAIWDNRCTQHFVLNDFIGERVIQRVTVMGDRVEAAEAAPWPAWTDNERRYSAATRHDWQLARHRKEAAKT